MPDTETVDKPLIEQLRDQRKALLTEATAALEARATETTEFRGQSDVTDEQRSEFDVAEEAFNAAHEARMGEIKRVDRAIDLEELSQRRLADAAKASRHDVSIVKEPMTYREDNGREHSYFRDLAATMVKGVNIGDPTEAQARLDQHRSEMNVEIPARRSVLEARAARQIDQAEHDFTGSFVTGVRQRRLDVSPFERRVTPNRLDGQGGYGVPPLWLVDLYITALRAGRVAAGLCRQMDLPEGTDSINIPKLATTTLTAPQTADATPVASQDFTDTAVTANVKTLAGQSDVALQLIEQSPGQIMDRVIMEDLIADYNRLVDRQVIYSPGTNASQLNAGQIAGIYPSTNWTATTVATATAAANSGPGFNQTLGALASKTSYNRYSLENFHYLLHPRRWFWFATALDGASGTVGRPVVSAEGFGPFNVSALESDVPAEGLAGRVPFGPSVYIDGNVPTTDNGSGALSGTYDVAIGAKWDDLWLFEGALRTRVLSEVLSGTLELRYQCYNYVAFLVRYGQSIALAQGAGLAAPTGAIDTAMTF